MAQRWEYKTQWCDANRLDQELAPFGAEGWELVAVAPGMLTGNYMTVIAVFKRPLS